MDVLKKIKATTLIETLVASAIILVVFVMGSISISNIFMGTLKNDTHDFDHRVSELEYLTMHKKLALPFFEDTDLWDISIESKGETMVLNGLDKESEKTVEKKLIDE